MRIDPDSYFEAITTDPAAGAGLPYVPWRLVEPRAFAWKTALLAVTTAAFVPILLWRNELAAIFYAAALAIVHVAGLGILASSIRWRDMLWRPLVMRVVAITVLLAPLALVSDGLRGGTGIVFWTSLSLVWVLHTAALLVVHVRGPATRRASACPLL